MKRRAFVQGMTAAASAAAIGRPGWAQRWPLDGGRQATRLDAGWRFLRDDPDGAENPAFDDSRWESVTLPHSARIEALVDRSARHARRTVAGTLLVPATPAGRARSGGGEVLLRFEGAMNVAEVWLDGERVGGHLGGYLPFVLDLGARLEPGREHLLAVRLDNRDNPITGPKPLAQLDFNLYHGLYRSVYLIRKDRLAITDPLLADRPAGGGVMVTYPLVVARAGDGAGADSRAQRLRRGPGARGAGDVARSPAVRVAARASAPLCSRRRRGPAGGSGAGRARAAALESRRTEPLPSGLRGPRRGSRRPIRRACGSASGGSPSTTRASPSTGSASSSAGTNRHQEHPYVGYALPDAAQYRDARRIKEAGFDYVRLSHYPHDPAFMDACDELGLVVMDCIPGWQYFNPDPAFVDLQYRNCRELIRRDRNRPCVILWEVSLNESAMPPEFVARAHAIAHEEYPGDQCFTAGWTTGYDVFLQARQHGGCRDGRHRPCVVSEYGDWEYYAMNAGLDQTAWTDLTPAESNSRQLRWQGERALLQQATNFQEAHNDNLGTIAFADGLWVMYDYNRGYAPDVESSGCMDLFRLPKFSYHFFRSQRPPAAGPVVFIASHWMPGSAEEVRVFSNCEEVALSLDGRLLERRRPDRDRISTRLPHPPIAFQLRRLPARQAGGGGLCRRAAGRKARRPDPGPHRATDTRSGPHRACSGRASA